MAKQGDMRSKVEGRKSKDLGGRPTDYRAGFAERAYQYALLGATDVQMAGFFGVTEQTLNNWKRKHPRFFESIKRGKAEADAVIASSLFHRAKGFTCPDVHISTHEGQVIKTELVKYYPPDTTAGIFWLKNRQPELWRDKASLEHTGKDGGPVVIEELSAEECLKLAREKGLLGNKN